MSLPIAAAWAASRAKIGSRAECRFCVLACRMWVMKISKYDGSLSQDHVDVVVFLLSVDGMHIKYDFACNCEMQCGKQKESGKFLCSIGCK
jgi:hypothetical protein